MDVPPHQYIAFRANRLSAVSIVQEVFSTIKVSPVKYIGLLCASSFHLFYSMDSCKRRLIADIFLFIIVFVFYRTSPKEKGYLLVFTLAYLYTCFIL